MAFGYLAETFLHFGNSLDIELICRVTHAIGIADLFAGLDTEQDVVRQMMVFLQIMAIVGCDEIEVCSLSQVSAGAGGPCLRHR